MLEHAKTCMGCDSLMQHPSSCLCRGFATVLASEDASVGFVVEKPFSVLLEVIDKIVQHRMLGLLIASILALVGLDPNGKSLIKSPKLKQLASNLIC